jgi:hypothetical protein
MRTLPPSPLTAISRVRFPIATFVLRAQPANISQVRVDGKVKKRAGKLVGIDETRVRRLVKESHDYIMGLISSAGLDIRKG